MKKFGSCPLRSKTLVFPGFFAFLASSFGFPAYPCMSMPAGAASSCALPCPLVSRPVSRESRLETSIFSGETCGFVVEVQDSNYLSDVLKRWGRGKAAEKAYQSTKKIAPSMIIRYRCA
jgi:hypothetical protein